MALCFEVEKVSDERSGTQSLVLNIDSMEPAEGLEPSAPGLRKLRFTVPLCLCLCASVNFAGIVAHFFILGLLMFFSNRGE